FFGPKNALPGTDVGLEWRPFCQSCGHRDKLLKLIAKRRPMAEAYFQKENVTRPGRKSSARRVEAANLAESDSARRCLSSPRHADRGAHRCRFSSVGRAHHS